MSKNFVRFIFILIAGLLSVCTYASGKMTESEMDNVEKKALTDADRKNQEQIAVTLASYEFEATKLVDLVEEQQTREPIDDQALRLMDLSEIVIDWAKFRLVQCEAYLNKSLELKDQLHEISHDSLESNYHQDGLLPKAPPECYHMKDMFIHPATVLVLTRDDPELNNETRTTIKAEIVEVLAHTEIVRQLVLY